MNCLRLQLSAGVGLCFALIVAAGRNDLLDELCRVGLLRKGFHRFVIGRNAEVAWGQLHTITFKHPLGVGERGHRRFDVGPFLAAGYGDTVQANAGGSGPSLRVIFDVSDWDRSVVTQAPGQSESPASPHFSDLAELWASGTYFPLVFTEVAVQAHAKSTLTLVPK